MLVTRMSGGDERAMVEFYDQHGRLVYGLAWQILRDRAEAEASTKDVFVHVWQNARADAGREDCPISRRVRLARHDALARLRSRGRSPSVVSEDTPLAAVDVLSDDQRRLIDAVYFRGRSSVELSEELGVPVAQVVTQIAEAMRVLRAHFTTASPHSAELLLPSTTPPA